MPLTPFFTNIARRLLALMLMLSLGSVLADTNAILEGQRSHPVEAANGMVATSHAIATDVALEVLKNGGNAIDAAVTAGFALAVTQPRSGNIGGAWLYACVFRRQQRSRCN